MNLFNLAIALLLAALASGAAAQARFDLSVNNAPAAQVFMQIGSGTPYNMLVSPEVSAPATGAITAIITLSPPARSWTARGIFT